MANGHCNEFRHGTKQDGGQLQGGEPSLPPNFAQTKTSLFSFVFFFIFFSKTLLPEPPQLSTTPLGIRRGPKRRAKAAIGPVRESKMMVKGLRRYNVDNGDHHRRHKLPKDPKPFNFQQRILEPPSTK